MEGGDEIIFTGAYKDFSLGVKFDLSGKGPAEAAAALAYISAKIEPHAFRFSGIDVGAIEKLAAPKGLGVGGVTAFLENIPPSELRAKLLEAVPKPELYPAAESYLVNQLLTKAGVPFKIAPSYLKPTEEKIEDFIGFVGKYNQWISIKKLGLENVQDYEVSGILSGINYTAVNKAFDLAGVKTDVSQVPEVPKRKSFGNLGQSLHELEGRLGGSTDDAYSICKRLEKLGYKPYASPDMLTQAYPDIKPPKVKGRRNLSANR